VARRGGWQRVVSATVGTMAATALFVWLPTSGPPLPPPLAPVTVSAPAVPDFPAAVLRSAGLRAPVPGPEEAAASIPVDELYASRVLHDAEAVLGVLEGHVVGDGGEALAGVLVLARAEEGGVHGARTDADGRFRFALPVGRLLVSASRWDDLVEVCSDDVLVALNAESPRYVPLTMQAGAGADAGLVAVEKPYGFEVRWAIPGLAAHELGLGEGDRIHTVDGRAASETTLAELESALVGAEGSEVRLGVERIDGERATLSVPRWGLDPATFEAAEEREG